MTDPAKYRQDRCPHGWVDVTACETCRACAQVEMLQAAICKTLDENSHLADGGVCTLHALKVALRESGAPWSGDLMDDENEVRQ